MEAPAHGMTRVALQGSCAAHCLLPLAVVAGLDCVGGGTVPATAA